MSKANIEKLDDHRDKHEPKRRAALKDTSAEQTTASARVNRTPENPRDHPKYKAIRKRIHDRRRKKSNWALVEDGRDYRELERLLKEKYAKYGNWGRLLEEDYDETEQQALRKMRYADAYERAEEAGKGDIMLGINPTVFHIVLVPSAPEIAFKEVLRRAEDGEHLTVKMAEEIVARHKGDGGAGVGGRGKGRSRKSATAKTKSSKGKKRSSTSSVDTQIQELKDALFDVEKMIENARAEVLEGVREWARDNLNDLKDLLLPAESEAAGNSAPEADADD